MVHPQPGDGLEQRQDLLAPAETEEHGRHRAELHAAGGQCDKMAGDPVEFHEHHPDDAGAFGDVVGDTEKFFHSQAIGRLVEERGQIVHPGHEGDTLCPGAVFEILLDPGVQIPDTAAGLGDGLALDLQDQAQHPVRGRVLRTHVDHDAFAGVLTRRGHDRIPVLAADHHDGRVCLYRHQLYDLRWSGGGICAPWYSTGMPPNG